MYYTSITKADLEEYNKAVNSSEGYSGTTTQWSEIIEHSNGLDFAILKHPNYDAELTTQETLSEDWLPSII